MIIREAKEEDIPEIIKVLKISLGDELPISENIWRYKHINNPFGSSIVLLAEDKGEIIGVRAFMKWEWCSSAETFKAYRAVDTATHPKHRGKGIFKKLTLAAVKKATEDEDSFIFNTPNDQSRPGYLKMGWKIAGNLKVAVRPSFSSFFKTSRTIGETEIINSSNPFDLEELCKIWNSCLAQDGAFFTPKSANYLAWRYEKNPLQDYFIYSDPEVFLSGTMRKRKKLKELRVTELISTTDNQKPYHIVKQWAGRVGAHVISFSPNVYHDFGSALTGKFGPILTVKNLNLDQNQHEKFLKVSNWAYSLGDLELF